MFSRWLTLMRALIGSQRIGNERVPFGPSEEAVVKAALQDLTGYAAGNTTLLQPGHVVSVEPGLYYPDRGFGVRIEDSVAFNEAGVLVNLSDYPYDLIVPMKK